MTGLRAPIKLSSLGGTNLYGTIRILIPVALLCAVHK